LVLLEKAELKIKSQNKIIDEFNKKKRIGGYGGINIDKPIVMHILYDNEDEEVDSNYDKESQASSRSGFKDYIKKNKMAVTQKSIKIDEPLVKSSIVSQKHISNGVRFSSIKH